MPYQDAKRTTDLSGHHAICELNFHQMLSLLPGLGEGVDSWNFAAGVAESQYTININVVESAKYTTTVAVDQSHTSLTTPRLVVRLYHDVNMAEIVAWDNHRHWKPSYPYPNVNMYHPDEKLALNRFLSDWLIYCRNQGLQATKTVIQFS